MRWLRRTPAVYGGDGGGALPPGWGSKRLQLFRSLEFVVAGSSKTPALFKLIKTSMGMLSMRLHGVWCECGSGSDGEVEQRYGDVERRRAEACLIVLGVSLSFV